MAGSTAVPDSRLSRRPLLVKLEFAVYWSIAIGVNLYGIHRMYQASQDPRSLALSRNDLSPAWFGADWFGGADFSDAQLSTFLSNLPLLTLAMAGFIALSRTVRNSAPSLLVYTHLAFNAGFLVFLHGPKVLFMLVIYLANFLWSRLHHKLPFAVYYGAAWIFHLAVLFSNDIYKGYKFAWIDPSLKWLDDMGGGMMRWNVIFNMSTLRMLGYLYDVWEANHRGDTTRAEQEAKHAENCVDCAETRTPCYRLRTVSPRKPDEYGVVNYLAFLSYMPLYIGGPLTSYNAYVSHLHIPQKAFDTTKCTRYAMRILGLYLTLAALLHVNHLSTLRRDGAAFERMTVIDKMLYGILFLAFLWLKFNMIWKFFRLVAIVDGVEAPEDMNRCFSNTTTVSDFWRDWHASFNQWIVRYMYVPLGGNKAKAFAIVPIFLFIAVWHDIELHLLWWAGIMVIAFIPELVVGAWFAKKCKWMRDRPYYRHVQALGCAMSTLSLVVANLFGYGTGMSSAKGVEGMAGSAFAVVWTVIFLFSTSNLGLYERTVRAEDELRRKVQVGLIKAK